MKSSKGRRFSRARSPRYFWSSHDKRGIELSVNFLVMLIIALAVFGFGVAFVYRLVGGASETRDLALEDIEDQLAQISCKPNEQICIDKEVIQLQKSKSVIVTAKVLNVQGDEAEFTLTVAEKKFYAPDGSPGDLITNLGDEVSIKPERQAKTIKNNEEARFGMQFRVENDARKGSYTFKLVVTNNIPGNTNVLTQIVTIIV